MLKCRVVGFVLAFVICHSGFVIDTVSAQETPVLTAPVNDFANVIDSASKAELDRRIRALQAATGDVVVVATVRTFRPYADIESYAVRMFENGGRGIGARGKDNGLLIVAAVDDRRVRIEVGYDLEQFITDAFSGDTIRTVMTPRFASGDYGGGLLAGATRIINRIAERRGATLRDVPRAEPADGRGGSRIPIGLIIFVIFIVLSIISRGGGGRGRRGGPWIVGGPWSGWNSGVGPFGGGSFGGGFGGFGGGSGGGGFGGFGGGRSGGGGASGGW